jgi:hypothetical protein
LTIGNQLGEKKTVPVPRGTHICIDTAALHRNREPPSPMCCLSEADELSSFSEILA